MLIIGLLLLFLLLLFPSRSIDPDVRCFDPLSFFTKADLLRVDNIVACYWTESARLIAAEPHADENEQIYYKILLFGRNFPAK